MATNLGNGIVLKKYGDRAYNVFINGEHWGNVCGYQRRNADYKRDAVFWNAVWFSEPAKIWVGSQGQPKFAGEFGPFTARIEAVREIKIQTTPDRR